VDALLTHPPIPITLRDLDGRLRHANPVAADLMGATAEGLIGRSVDEQAAAGAAGDWDQALGGAADDRP
jgi:PAS domain S-box-containing protein